MKLYSCLAACILLLLLISCKQTRKAQYQPLSLSPATIEIQGQDVETVAPSSVREIQIAKLNPPLQVPSLNLQAAEFTVLNPGYPSANTTFADTVNQKASKVKYNPIVSDLSGALSILLSLSSIRMSYLAAAIVSASNESSAAALALLFGLVAFFAGWMSLTYSRQKKGFSRVFSIIAIALGGLATVIAGVVLWNVLLY